MVQKGRFLLFTLVFVMFSVGYVSALGANYTFNTSSNGSIIRSSNNLINVTIGAVSGNISMIAINVTGSMNFDKDTFIADSNGTGASANFTNSSYSSNSSNPSMGYNVVLIWNSSGVLIAEGQSRSFWFNVTARGNMNSGFNVNVETYNVSNHANTNSSSTTFSGVFSFSGYIKNETGGYQNATNVSIYRFQEGNMGPPVEILVSTTLSDSNGYFSFTGINASPMVMYKLKMVYRDGTTAKKIGSSLPAFPSMMFYPQTMPDGDAAFAFMRPPNLNGTTFYLEPAATINITAVNGTGANQLFGYQIMEQKTGFPLESNMMGNVSSVQVVVPVNRSYNVMVSRFNSQFNNFWSNSSICNGWFMNDTACQTPPKSNTTTPSAEGQTTNISFNLTIVNFNLYGCIFNGSNAVTNITSISPKMLPWEGFVPPVSGDFGKINLSDTNQLNYSDYRCPGAIAFYNISLMGPGISYLVEFYGTNATGGASSPWAASFKSVVMNGSTPQTNATLRALAGSYTTSNSFGGINVSKVRVNLQNSTGGAISSDIPHVEVVVTHSDFGSIGTLAYVMELGSTSNGTFYLPIYSSATAKVKIFPNQAPPTERSINLSAGIINITLTSMSDGTGKAGFKKINSSGELQDMNMSDESIGLNMSFIKSSTSCDALYYDSSCILTRMGAREFNPMSAMVAGKINMEMKLTSSNVTLTFYNFDMFAAKQPPMESVMNDQASSGAAGTNPIWQFGSFVPAEVYDYVIIGMPYNDSVINETKDINVSVPALYDENWDVLWNSSAGNTTDNLTTSIDEYLGNSNNRSFNSTSPNYRSYLSGGYNCSKTNTSILGSGPATLCYINTSSNMIYMRIPHFSGVSPGVTGNAVSSSSTTTTTSTGGGGGGDSNSTSWVTIDVYNENETKSGFTKSFAKMQRVRIIFNGTTHYVGIINVSSASAYLNVTSEQQIANLNVGDKKSFELTGDNYYDISVKLNNIIGVFANITLTSVHELKPQTLNAVSNGSTGNGTNQNNSLTGENGLPKKSGIGLGAIIGIIIALVIIVAIILFYYYKISSSNINDKVKVKSFKA